MEVQISWDFFGFSLLSVYAGLVHIKLVHWVV